MSKVLGIKMIEMYEDMIKNDFEPLMDTCRNHIYDTQEEVLDELEKQHPLSAKLTELRELHDRCEVLVEDLTNVISKSYYNSPFNGSNYLTKIEQKSFQECEKNSPHAILYRTLEEARNGLLRRIRLSGLSGDVADVFADLPALFKSFQDKVNALNP